jgi:hypothetical protein
MIRVRLKGVNFATKTLADGTLRTYWYAWRGGPQLRGKPGTPDYVASYNAAVATKAATPHGVILSVLQGYQASENFHGLADTTRRSYVPLIKRIEKDFGDFPLSALTDRRTRGVFMAWRDKIAASSGRRQADYAWSVLARVFSWALDRGLVAANPCTHGGRLYRGSRAEKIWTDIDEATFLERAPAHLRLPLQKQSSLLNYLDPDRFWIEPLGASQLATTGVTACGAETIHFGAQINVRSRVEELLMLGEHRPYQIPLLIELHMLADV